jgi:pimeloyl-ACP methyl ester carboxylesterase
MTEASRNEASSQLVAWGGISRTADLDGPIHYVDFGGAAGAPAVPGLDAAFLSAARSLLRVSARRKRYWAAMRAVKPPVLLLHGEKDRLVSVHSAREAAVRNPDWRFEVLSDVGHVPQLEVPDAVADLILDWLGTEGATAARRAAEPAAGSRPGNGPTGVPDGRGGTPAR